MRKVFLLLFVALAIGIMPLRGLAGDRTVRTTITNVHVYMNGSYFVTLATAAMAPGSVFPTCTTVYKVDKRESGQNVVIATVLAAHVAAREVQIEISNLGCIGFGTLVTSIFVF